MGDGKPSWAQRAGVHSLTEAPFRTYFVGRTVSSVGSSMVAVALAFAVFAAGGTAGSLGLVLGAATVPKLVLVLLGGVFGDRLERRRILLATDLVMGAVQGLTAVLLLTGRAHIWQLAVLQVLYGCASAFSTPATIGTVRDLASPSVLQQANSLLRIARSTVGIVGPSLAGVLVVTVGPGWALAVDAATFLFSAVAMARLPATLGRAAPGRRRVLSELADGWRLFTSMTWVWVSVLGFAAYQATVLPGIFVLGPSIAQTSLGGAGSWAVILSARSAGGLLVGVALLHWRPRRPLVTMASVMFLDVPFLLALALGAPVWLIAVAGALSAAAVGSADTFWETALQQHVPPDAISRISSYDWMGSLVIAPLGFGLIGFVSVGLGVVRTLVGVAVIAVLIHVLMLVPRTVRGLARLEPDVAVDPRRAGI